MNFYKAGLHAVVTDPRGRVIYDGSCPVPSELVTITPEMAARGEFFTFDVGPEKP